MKRLLMISLAAMAFVGAKAELLDPSDALERALQDIPAGTARRALRAQKFNPVKTVALNSPEAELYVFGASSGLMIVSAESDAPALLGYSDSYMAGQPLPPALEMMLESYAAEIASLRVNGFQPRSASRADFEEIEPICKTTWDQGSPYNLLTPTIDGVATYTGCVATAIAQVLKTYEYPQKGTGGVYSYYWSRGGKYISLDFDEITFDWTNMLDSYAANGSNPEANKLAVATLMQACGYAADMGYGTEASGASGLILVRGLVRNLNYDPSLQYLERSFFSLQDWTQKVYDELSSGHPVYYDGTSINNEGHAFVVDGYSSDGYFHLNWGWGGMANGYFRLTALDPLSQGIGGAASGAGFDLQQGAIFGLKPNSGTEEAQVPLLYYSTGAFAINTGSVTLGSNVSVSYTAYNGGNFKVEYVSPALCFTSAADGSKKYTKSATVYSPMEPLTGFNYGAIPTPAGLAPGNYIVTPAVYSDITKEYYHAYGPLALGQSVAASVSGTRITFNGTQKPDLWAPIIDAPEVIFPRRNFKVNLTLTNNSLVPFTGAMYLALCNEGKTITKAYLSTFVANIDGDSTEEISVTANLANLTLPEGTYDIYLLDSNRDIISNPGTVTLTIPDDLAILTASNLTVVSQTTDDLRISVDIAAKDGNYTGEVWLQIHNRGDYTNYIERFPAPIKLKNGGSTTVTLGGKFAQGVPGKYYTAYIYYTREGVETECSGRQRKTFMLQEGAAIEEVAADSRPVTLYDLSGRKVANPRRGQIYVTDNKTKIIY